HPGNKICSVRFLWRKISSVICECPTTLIRQSFSITVLDKVNKCSIVLAYLSIYECPSDQEFVSKLAEVDMIVADLERANSRVATVERRNVRTGSHCLFRIFTHNNSCRRFYGLKSKLSAVEVRQLTS